MYRVASTTQSKIELIVEAVRAINPLRQTKKETAQLHQTVDQAQNNIRKLNSTLNQTGTSSQKAAAGMNSLAKAVRNLAIGEFIRRSVTTAATLNDLDLQLSLITKKYGEYDTALEIATKAQRTFGLSQRESLADINSIYARLRPLGISLEDISSTYIGFNTVAKLSGTTAMEASAAFRQLSQAMGRGTLQGDEFVSMSENLPGVLNAVALELKVEVGQLKDLSKAGAITTDVLIKAFKRLKTEGADAIAEVAKKSDIGRFKEFTNAVERLQQAIGNTLLPALRPTVDLLTEMVKVVAAIPQPIKDMAAMIGIAAFAFDALRKSIVAVYALRLASWLKTQAALFQFFGAQVYFAAGGMGALQKAVALVGFAIKALPWAIIAAAIAIYIKDVKDAKEATDRFNNSIAAGTTKQLSAALAAEVHTNALIAQRIEQNKKMMEASGNRGGGFALIAMQNELEASNKRILKLRDELNMAGEREETQYQEQQKKLNQIVDKGKARKDLTAEQIQLEKLLFAAKIKQDHQEIAYIQKLIKREEILNSEMEPRRKIKAFLENEIEYSEKVKQLRKDIADIMAGARIAPSESTFDGKEVDLFKPSDKRADHFKELKQNLTDLLNPMKQIQSLSASIADAFGESIQSMVQGTATARQALGNLFRSVSQSFLNMATDIIKAAIRMMAFKIIASLFPGGATFAASSVTAPGLSGSLAKPGILPGISGGLGGVPSYGGGMAKGGKVSGGTSYLVGEKGPELFMPGRSGSIIPNNAMGGANVTVNVDASGSNVEGNADQANQLGKAIGLAVQQELIKQKRPGGLLAGV